MAEEPVGGDLPIKRHSAPLSLWSSSSVVVPNKNTLGRHPLPPDFFSHFKVKDCYTNTAHSYAEESTEEAAGADKAAPL